MRGRGWRGITCGRAACRDADRGRCCRLHDRTRAEIERTIRAYSAPVFAVAGLSADAVKVYLINDNRLNAFVAGGHTRLPSYAAGAVGRILHHHGAHVLPDANAHGRGESPEHLYTVVFDAAELWGAPERAGDEVTCDLWQSYLEPA